MKFQTRGQTPFLALLVLATVVWAGEPVRIGTSGDYAPFSQDGQGFDVEVAKLLAADLGYEIEWVRFRWPELRATVERGGFDVAMGGITWRPDRAVIGWMTRAVAAGGPCLVGDSSGGKIAVNRGGVLERWAKGRFPSESIVAVDDNRSLPRLLASGEVSAFVTDSFEIRALSVPTKAQASCEPPRDRKVYWVAPSRAADLGPAIDAWLAENEPRLRELRRKWLGAPSPRDEIDHIVDLLARRLALMPAVAAWKRAHGVPIEDAAREQTLLPQVESRAAELGLDPAPARRLFELQIELAKSVQRRSSNEASPAPLDELRSLISRTGEEILASVATVVPIEAEPLAPERLMPLGEWLDEGESDRLRAALLALRRTAGRGPATSRGGLLPALLGLAQEAP